MRYEEVTEQTKALFREVKGDDFSELAGANIKLLFDTKKKKSGGKYVLARIQKPNELTRYFTIDEADSTEGFDYIIFLDKMLWDNMEDIDRKRIIRHELKHTDVDIDANSPWKLRGHTVEDFYSEIERNNDDPRWGERLGFMLDSLYEGDEE